MKNLSLRAVLVAGILAISSHGVLAADMATGAEIKAKVTGNSIQGSMLTSRYAEFYGADGVNKGDGYSGKWTVTDSSMCFQYGDAAPDCWEVEIKGPAVIFYKDGTLDGIGMVVEGNPNNF